MLDFRMKHEGEPPARLLAQLRMTMKGKGLPPIFADALAPCMVSADELDADTVAELTALAHFLERKGVAAETALAALKQVTADLVTEGEGDAADGNPADAGVNARLVQRIAAKLNPLGPIIDNRAPRERRAAGQNMMMSALANQIAAGGRTVQGDSHTVLLSDVAMHYARAAGHNPRNRAEGVRMAMHSTSDFPRALEGVLGNAVARRMEQVTPGLLRASHLIEAGSYHQRSLLGLSASGMPQEISEGGEIKSVTIDEKGELKPTPRDFGSMFNISQRAIVNDDLGLFQQITNQMVAGATERFRRVLLEPLLANSGLGNTMSDGFPVFHASHKNLAASGSALSIEAVSAARVALRSQTGKQGELYGYEPWALVVPAQLETTAQQIVAQITAATVSEVNPFSGKLEVIVEAGLTDPKAWYLIADPAKHDGHAHAFLEGRSAPSVESREGWNNLGLEFRLVWALDARFVSYSSWFKNPGA